jgi:glycosyltransferase involved in cell wall biosynthesis
MRALTCIGNVRYLMPECSNRKARRIRVLTNLTRLGRSHPEAGVFELRHYTPVGVASAFSAFARSYRHDYVLVNGSLNHALLLILLKQLVPSHRARVVLLDVLLSMPKGPYERAKARVLGKLLRRAHRILLYYRNTAGWQEHYNIPANRFAFVPFKINGQNLISQTRVTDQGFIFCGGKTRRDFATLFEAVRGLDYPVRVATASNEDIKPHGSFVDEGRAPCNLEIVRLDGSPDEFISLMAASRLVVLPITPEISGAGISVYIQAMALGKCVILSAGPAAEDVLTDGQAIIVPPSDPAALRAAIVRAYNDSDYRERVARRGHDWAMTLGGEERLFSSILSLLKDDHRCAALSGATASGNHSKSGSPET